MRIIALINQKGGCGKTTSSINLAACLAHAGQRTLLVDMDPQSHCAVGLAVPDAQIQRSVYDVLREENAGPTLKDITWEIAARFDLAPSALNLTTLETELHGIAGRQDRLSNALARVSDKYDFCVIDCPPNVGLLTFNAMRAADEVIIPVETGYFSLHGLAKQLELLEQLRKQCNQNIRIRILATLYDIRTKLAREVLGELREQFGEMLMEATINFNTKLKEAASFGQPITEYDPASKGFKDFQKLARELMGPAPRITLDLNRAIASNFDSEEGLEKSLEQSIDIARETVGEALEDLHSISEPPASPLSSASEPMDDPISRDMPIESPTRRMPQVLVNADALIKKAEEVRINAAHMGVSGVAIAQREMTTAQKIDNHYGVRQVPQGLLFTAHFPGVNSVGVAGDFNAWNPQRMVQLDDENTFRTLVALKPGRYRYRLVVDGLWQPDPFNAVTEPNPFGDIDSVVEVR